jgi:hypothetical protein
MTRSSTYSRSSNSEHAEAVAQTEASERDHRGASPEPPGGFSLHGDPDGGGISATLQTSAGG